MGMHNLSLSLILGIFLFLLELGWQLPDRAAFAAVNYTYCQNEDSNADQIYR